MNKFEEALTFLRSEDLTALDNANLELLYFHLDNIEELVDKATPKKPIIIPNNMNLLAYRCPVCVKRTYTNFRRNYCSECGQALDWSEDDGE